MLCNAPLPAWRIGQKITLAPPSRNSAYHGQPALLLPCGTCLGCARQHAQQWAFRCRLEASIHRATSFATLTYNAQHLPPTLSKRHYQLFLKRLRKRANRLIRYFGSGEYGDRNHRPHYHFILFGIAPHERSLIADAWHNPYTNKPMGRVSLDPCTPDSIGYVAGYCDKKLLQFRDLKRELVDPNTGEVYTWQPSFIEMSTGGRNGHGIGGHARQWPHDWRLYAIKDGHKIAVPRYLHQAWLDQATEQDKQQLLEDKEKFRLGRETTFQSLHAKKQIQEAQQAIYASKRQL